MTLESICYQIWLMTQFQRDESHAGPSTFGLPFSQPRGLIVGYPLTLGVAAVRCTHAGLGAQELSFFRHVLCQSIRAIQCDSIWWDMMGYDVRCNQSVVTSGFVLLAQRLSFRGAVHICNERSRAAVELIHQLVPIRFQLLAVAWYNLKKIKGVKSNKEFHDSWYSFSCSHQSSPGCKEFDENTLPCCFRLSKAESKYEKIWRFEYNVTMCVRKTMKRNASGRYKFCDSAMNN